MSDVTNISYKQHLVFRGKIKVLSGLHIGGSDSKMEIGGVDNPVIKDPYTHYPFIPGSSIKGKMRSQLAYFLGKAKDDPSDTFDINCPLQRIFGTPADTGTMGPTRLVIRDAHPDSSTIKMWKDMDSELLYTEYKPENTVNRITSEANPRFMERVAKDSTFTLEMIFGLYEFEPEDESRKKDEEFINHFFTSLKLLEQNFLGGHGSRGYGQIEIKLDDPIVLSKEDFTGEGKSWEKLDKEPEKLHPLSHFDKNWIKDHSNN